MILTFDSKELFALLPDNRAASHRAAHVHHA